MSYMRRHNRPNSYRKIAQPEGHNSAQFLEVMRFEGLDSWRDRFGPIVRCGKYRPNMRDFAPGWYVVRVCDCHRGEVVIVWPYASAAAADAGVRLLVESAMVFDT